MDHRLFFALLPPESAWPAIGGHANAAGESRVPGNRLHMTLAITPVFKQFPQETARQLIELGSGVVTSPVDVSLEKISAWGDALVLQPGRPIPALADLQDRLETGMARRGLLMDGWSFSPHMTLSYRFHGRPFSARIDPIAWESRDFVLIDSHVGASRYDVLGRWPLKVVQPALL